MNRCTGSNSGPGISVIAMLAIVIEYSKLLLLLALIGTVVTLSRFGSSKQSPLPSRDRSSYSL